MTKKVGRPPKLRKQEKFVGFFVTKVQYFVIQDGAGKIEEAGMVGALFPASRTLPVESVTLRK